MNHKIAYQNTVRLSSNPLYEPNTASAHTPNPLYEPKKLPERVPNPLYESASLPEHVPNPLYETSVQPTHTANPLYESSQKPCGLLILIDSTCHTLLGAFRSSSHKPIHVWGGAANDTEM